LFTITGTAGIRGSRFIAPCMYYKPILAQKPDMDKKFLKIFFLLLQLIPEFSKAFENKSSHLKMNLKTKVAGA
jgi:hypothetical protein